MPLVSSFGMHPLNDDRYARLLSWIDADEQAAANRLFRMRRQLVMMFTQRGFGREAEDLAHDVIMTMADKCRVEIPSYQVPEQLMVGIARNVLKRCYERREPELPGERELVERHSDASVLPEHSQSDERRCLDSSLARLSEEERALLEEYISGDEWDRAAMARRNDVTPGALRVRIHRMLKQLDRLIQECLESMTGVAPV